MSHINNIERIDNLRIYLDQLSKDDVSKETIGDILHELLPKNDKGYPLVAVNIREKGNTVAYIPAINTIKICKPRFNEYAYRSAEVLSEETGIGEVRRLATYYKLFTLLHESEHGLQFLIAKDKIPFEHTELKDGYKNIINILAKPDYIIPRPFMTIKHVKAKAIYEKNQYDYVLERNASVEAANDVSHIADLENEEEVKSAFEVLALCMKYIGYENDTKGSMHKTYYDLGLKSKYDKIKHSEMSEEDRLRFGLEISNETRNKLLEKVNSNNFGMI